MVVGGGKRKLEEVVRPDIWSIMDADMKKVTAV
jgi:hypothetical protein